MISVITIPTCFYVVVAGGDDVTGGGGTLSAALWHGVTGGIKVNIDLERC